MYCTYMYVLHMCMYMYIYVHVEYSHLRSTCSLLSIKITCSPFTQIKT